MKEKWLYKFVANKTETKTEVKKVKDSDGKEVTETNSETIEKPVTIAIAKPRRRLYEDSELFHGVRLSEGIKAGLLTRHLIAKRYDNDGGLFSESERDEYASLIILKNQKIKDYQMSAATDSDKEKAEENSAKLLDELIIIEEQIQNFESERSSLFEKTADVRAENQLVMWWTFMLAHYSDKQDPKDEDFIPVFGEGDFDKRLESYDEFYDEEDDFWLPVSKKLAFLTSFWHNGNIKSQEGFSEAEGLFDKNFDKDLEESSETAAEENPEQEDAPKEEEAPEEEKITKEEETAEEEEAAEEEEIAKEEASEKEE